MVCLLIFCYRQKLFIFRCAINTLRPKQNGRHLPDDIFKCIFLNENGRISIQISLKFVPKFPINNITTFVQVMAWRRPGDKPLSEPMTVSLLTHICVTRPQWVKNDFEGMLARASLCCEHHKCSPLMEVSCCGHILVSYVRFMTAIDKPVAIELRPVL